MYSQNHLANALRAGSVERESAPFLTHATSGEGLSFGAFFARGEQMAAALVHLGVAPGDRVAIQAPKTAAMLELYLGCVLAGAVFLPLNPAYTAPEVAYFLSDARPVVFVCDPACEGALAGEARAAGCTQLLTLDANETGSLCDARDSEQPGFKPALRGPEDLAAILYTSGTTGRSKGAMLSHRALASNSLALKDVWRFTKDDVLLHALPIFHTHGLFVATNIALMAGAGMVFFARFDEGALLKAMPRATAMMGVPTFYTRLLKADGLADAAADMRLFISGSAPLLAETHDAWHAVTGHAILERYGMTETNMNTSNPYDGERRAGTVGFPLPGIELKVCDAAGKELPHGEVGVLEVRGDNVFSGYWQMPEKTAEELRDDGFFITGDLGRIDDDGYVQIVGRQKDLIISGGFNIYPKEVEAVIDDLTGVIESAVIGVPHPDFGEAVVAVVVCDANAPAAPDFIQAQCRGQLAAFKLPKHVIFTPDLPRNTMGKVQKAALRAEHAGLFSTAS